MEFLAGLVAGVFLGWLHWSYLRPRPKPPAEDAGEEPDVLPFRRPPDV